MSSSAQRASGEWFHTVNHEYMANLPKSMSRKSLAPYTARIPHFSVGRRRHGRGRRSGRSVFPNIQSGVRGVNLPRGLDMISKCVLYVEILMVPRPHCQIEFEEGRRRIFLDSCCVVLTFILKIVATAVGLVVHKNQKITFL